MTNFLVLARSIKFLKTSQIFYRLIYLFKRNLISLITNIFPSIIPQSPYAHNILLKTNLPKSLFLPKSKQVEKTLNGWKFNFLNEEVLLREEELWIADKERPRLWNMTLHYFEWTVPLSDEDFKRIITAWIHECRPYSAVSWYASWNSYSVSLRCVAWIKEYSSRHKNLDKPFLDLFRNSILEHIRFLDKNLELDLGGNHLIKNIKALLWGLAFFDDPSLEKLQKKAFKLLKKQIEIQILNDGFHYELSPSYHLQVFEDLLECYELLPNSDLKYILSEPLKRMNKVSSAVTFNDGNIALFGDSGFQMARNPSELQKVYKDITGDFEVSEGSIYLKDSGYFVFKNDKINLIYDAGRIGPDELTAHSHGDLFSFELCLEGQRVFVDKGVFEYAEGLSRDMSRSSKSHNTLTLNGIDQAEFWSSFRTGRRPNVTLNEYEINENTLKVDAQHDGFSHLKGKPIHRRVFNYDDDKKIIRILDKIKSSHFHTADISLLLHPLAKVTKVDGCSVVIQIRDWEVRVVSKDLNITLKDENWWPDLGLEQSCKQISFTYPSSQNRSEIYIHLIKKT